MFKEIFGSADFSNFIAQKYAFVYFSTPSFPTDIGLQFIYGQRGFYATKCRHGFCLQS